MTKTTFSTNKIVLLLAFIGFSSMASLFIYHATAQTPQHLITTENSTLFPVGRDIKSFTLETTSQTKFTEKNLLAHWTLLMFGFTHCTKVCPTNMTMMNRVYEKLHNAYPNLQIVLITVDPKRDDAKTMTSYTQSFHPDFIGVTGKIQDLRKLQSQLGIYVGTDAESNSDNYQIDHSPSILLINPRGQLVGLFKYGQSPETFSQTFLDSMQSLKQA